MKSLLMMVLSVNDDIVIVLLICDVIGNHEGDINVINNDDVGGDFIDNFKLEINGDINAYDVNDDKDVSEILQSLALEPMQTLRLVQLLLQVTRRL